MLSVRLVLQRCSSVSMNRGSLVGPLCTTTFRRFSVPHLSQRRYSSNPDRNSLGVFTPKSAALFVSAGVALFFYFRHEKAKLLEQRENDRASKQFGRPQIGGPFTLVTQDGKTFTEKNLRELDKVTAVMNAVGAVGILFALDLSLRGGTTENEHGSIFQPIFISVDPARDAPSRIGKYLKDFHSSFIGLVGSYEETKATCKAYRVYFSTPPNSDPAGDYLVDHSIFVYLMDPEGRFVEAFGQSVSEEEVVKKVREVLGEWQENSSNTV